MRITRRRVLQGLLLVPLACDDDDSGSPSGGGGNTSVTSTGQGGEPGTAGAPTAGATAGGSAPVGGSAGAGGEGGGAPFIPGETVPYYEESADLDEADKNIGNLPDVARTPYPDTVARGTTVISDAGVYEDFDFIDTVVDVRANAEFKNCRFQWSPNFVASTFGGTRIMIAVLNGGATLVTFEDCEVHCRSQTIANCFMGRNAKFYRTAFTGGVDQCNVADTGSAPQAFGVELYDCFVGWSAIWYDPTPDVVHNNDTMVHADGSQVTTALGYRAVNTTYGMWVSAHSGTGTPGSGSETNANTAPYIHSQATMDGYRASYLGLTLPAQSFRGIARPVPLEGLGGSHAAVMCNRDNGYLERCTLSGARVPINLRDAALPATVNWEIRSATVYNDMVTGRPLSSMDKGWAFFGRSSKSYPLVHTAGMHASHWFDGDPVALVLS